MQRNIRMCDWGDRKNDPRAATNDKIGCLSKYEKLVATLSKHETRLLLFVEAVLQRSSVVRNLEWQNVEVMEADNRLRLKICRRSQKQTFDKLEKTHALKPVTSWTHIRLPRTTQVSFHSNDQLCPSTKGEWRNNLPFSPRTQLPSPTWHSNLHRPLCSSET